MVPEKSFTKAIMHTQWHDTKEHHTAVVYNLWTHTYKCTTEVYSCYNKQGDSRTSERLATLQTSHPQTVHQEAACTQRMEHTQTFFTPTTHCQQKSTCYHAVVNKSQLIKATNYIIYHLSSIYVQRPTTSTSAASALPLYTGPVWTAGNSVTAHHHKEQAHGTIIAAASGPS